MPREVKQLLQQEVELPAGQVDVLRTLRLFDELVEAASDTEAIRFGEEFLPQIAAAYADKAAYVLERTLAPDPQRDDPPFQVEWLHPYMRRYQQIDLSPWFGRAPNDYPAERQAVTVSELSSEEAEQFIREPVAIAHPEDVMAWSERISTVLRGSMSFDELQQETRLTTAELTLGILLGGFAAQQRGEFYDRAGFTVSPPPMELADEAELRAFAEQPQARSVLG